MLLKASCFLVLVATATSIPLSYVAGLPQQQQYRLPPHPQPQIQAQIPSQLQHQPQFQHQPQLPPQPQPQPQALPQPAYHPQAPGPEEAQPQYVDPQRPGPPRGQFLPNPEDYDPNPQYQFSFDVKDDQFTNYQNRKESRDGDKISGSYSVVDSDGFIRTVKYTADPLQGFKAEVTREPTDIVVKLPTPQPVLQRFAPGPIADTPSGPGGQSLTPRQQQTQQYLQAAQLAAPQSQFFSSVAQPVPARHPAAAPPRPKPLRAGAVGFASQQPVGGNVLYQAYQQ